MSLTLYIDHHVHAGIALGLRKRGVDVLTAAEDGHAEAEDSALFDRATSLNRVLFSQDRDLRADAAERQQTGRRFAGLVYAHQLGITIGRCIDDLELRCAVLDLSEIENRVIFLPL